MMAATLKRDWISLYQDPNIIYVTGVPQSALAPGTPLQMDLTPESVWQHLSDNPLVGSLHHL
jgi:hypothetical protein